MPLTIGIDPGSRSGIAAFSGPNLAYASAIKSRSNDPHPKLNALRSALRELGVQTVRGVVQERVALIVESQFLGGGGDAKRFSSSASVVKSAGVWEACGLMRGLIVLDPVLPASWRAVVGLAGPKRIGDESREKLLADTIAARFFKNGRDEDRNAAIMIAMYGQMKELGWSGKYDKPCPGFEWTVGERCTRMANKRKARRRGNGNDSD